MRYQIVGWYSLDGSNPHIMPFPRVVTVDADSPEEAYRKGSVELARVYNNTACDFLNWFIKELK